MSQFPSSDQQQSHFRTNQPESTLPPTPGSVEKSRVKRPNAPSSSACADEAAAVRSTHIDGGGSMTAGEASAVVMRARHASSDGRKYSALSAKGITLSQRGVVVTSGQGNASTSSASASVVAPAAQRNNPHNNVNTPAHFSLASGAAEKFGGVAASVPVLSSLPSSSSSSLTSAEKAAAARAALPHPPHPGRGALAVPQGLPVLPPGELLRRILVVRGYDVEPVHALQTSEKFYHRKPTPLQVSAYDMEIVNVVRSCQLDRLKELHAHGKTIDACNRFGESVLHMACRGAGTLVPYLLQECGLAVNISDDFGRTPLHDACWKAEPNFEVVKLLLTADRHLVAVADSRDSLPLSYVPEDHWAVWCTFLLGHCHLFWAAEEVEEWDQHLSASRNSLQLNAAAVMGGGGAPAQQFPAPGAPPSMHSAAAAPDFSQPNRPLMQQPQALLALARNMSGPVSGGGSNRSAELTAAISSAAAAVERAQPSRPTLTPAGAAGDTPSSAPTSQS